MARWLINTTALLLRARMALAWIWVLGGRTPLARRVMMDLGRVRSCWEGVSATRVEGVCPAWGSDLNCNDVLLVFPLVLSLLMRRRLAGD